MKKILLLLLLNICVISCNKEAEITFSDKYKLDVLDEVLTYVNDSNLVRMRDSGIARHPFYPPLDYFSYDSILNKYTHETGSNQIKIIAKLLAVSDTVFIHKQIDANKTLDLGLLSNYGYKIVNNKNVEEGNDLSVVSKPIFNKERTKVFVRFYNVGSGGKSYVVYKVNNKWSRFYEIENFVE